MIVVNKTLFGSGVVCGMWELHPLYITIVQVRDSEVKSINTHFITLVSVEGIVALATA